MAAPTSDTCQRCGHAPIQRMYVQAAALDLCRCPACEATWEVDRRDLQTPSPLGLKP
jgi:transcription elongation factor Elf1